jgi:hypothetical protein
MVDDPADPIPPGARAPDDMPLRQRGFRTIGNAETFGGPGQETDVEVRQLGARFGANGFEHMTMAILSIARPSRNYRSQSKAMNLKLLCRSFRGQDLGTDEILDNHATALSCPTRACSRRSTVIDLPAH